MKFKFLKHSINPEYVDIDELKEVDNPLPYNNLPEGEYLIRGDKKEQRKEYWKVEDKWYLIDDVKKDNGHYYVDATRYLLFPSLSKKEWEYIEKAGWKRLNKLWQRYLFAYKHWLDIEEIRKSFRKMRLEFLKEENDK